MHSAQIISRGRSVRSPVLFGLLTRLNKAECQMTGDRVMESIVSRKATAWSIGCRPKKNQAQEHLVLSLRDEAFFYRSIREQTGPAILTTRRIISDQDVVKC